MGDCPQMNLRSIFTEEQQRVLQRYYDSGMTNQSKNCFGLIIQCARETGLDFNVVRTWIGNKRRKLNSTKYSLDDAPSMQGPAGNSMVGKPDIPVKNTSRVSPTQSQQTILTSSSCRNVMVTGVFTSTHSTSGQGLSHQKDGHRCDIPKSLIHRPIGRTITEMELQQHACSQRQSISKNPAIPICEKMTPGSRQLNVHSPTSTVYSSSTKNYSPAYVQAEINRVQSAAAKSVGGWPKQFNSTVAEVSQCPRKINSETPFSRSTSSSSDSKVNRGDTAVSSLQIRDVYSLAGSEQSQRNRGEHAFRNLRQVESGCFSIAMETGDVDEYAREEELASMSSEMKNHPRVSEANAPKEMECSNALVTPTRNISTGSSQVSARDVSGSVFFRSGEFRTPGTTMTLYNNAASSEDSFNLRLPSSSNQRLTSSQNNYQVSGSVLLPCITGTSRKRTLQDRTQFSETDLAVLKKYWDVGMTSLGSICREKIEAVAMESNVDCEIVKTWIGNRRRKYRQLGIELPPARGGPADFSKLPESGSALLSVVKAETTKVPESSEDNVRNKEDASLSEGTPSELELREEEEEEDEETAEENGDGESVSDGSCSIPTLEKVNDKIKYLENELEKQKQKYLHLQSFTTSLVLAVKTNDTEQQQMLLTNLPLDTECNMDSPGNREQS
ncbi:highly divergent homeobox isoform X4 [Scyliorhinus canicula]|uniref:highly divergent homeobox isoform X4 n=1 Tax=Scyliorhinus canicula TaxID=7830 RepID=UPI0018F3C03B|nr:highly divergent homeobox isoform X4 [Scyliorhinus canicula]